MELFRNDIRQADFVLPSEVAPWIQLLESGHQDPILVLLLSLLPNLRILSLGNHPGQTLLFTTTRRIAENAASKSFSKLKSFRLSYSIFDQSEGVSLLKPFVLLPSMEKMSCHHLDDRHRGRAIPYCPIVPQSSNLTESVFDSCGDMANYISVLLEGMTALKKFTYVAVDHTVDAFWIRFALLSHCRQSLEYLKMGFKYGEPNYMGSLHSFERLAKLDVDHSLLVDSDTGDDYDVADMLSTSIQAIDLRGRYSKVVSHICPFIRSLINAKRTRLPNLNMLTYRLLGPFESSCPSDSSSPFDSREYIHAKYEYADMCRLCERNGVFLFFE